MNNGKCVCENINNSSDPINLRFDNVVFHKHAVRVDFKKLYQALGWKIYTDPANGITYDNYLFSRNNECLSFVHKKRKGRLMKLNKFKTPPKDVFYWRICLSKDGKNINRFMHRILGILFIPNPEEKYSIDHIDRNGLNNDLSNLRWATREEQAANKRNSGGAKITLGGSYDRKNGQIIYQWRESNKQKSKEFKTKDEREIWTALHKIMVKIINED